MSSTPLSYHLRKVPWQFYCTLTFGSGWSPKPTKRKLERAFTWLRATYGHHGIKIRDARWILCPEDGEMGGRHHYHALLADLPRATRGDTYALAWLWNQKFQTGSAIVRLYDPALDGVGYCIKQSEQYLRHGLSYDREEANAFEVNKIDRAYDAIPSHSLVASMRECLSSRGRRRGRVKLRRDRARNRR